MERRHFLAASLAASAVAVTRDAVAQAPAARTREFYQLRRYSLQNGPQLKLTESYFADALILRVAAPFWNATAAAPAYQRVEVSLLAAFEGWPKLTPPASSATKAKRIFQLRIYESPSDGEHVRKVEMFHAGEFDIFVNAGCHPVFFADSLIGPRLPNLTYMLTFADIDELNAKWDIFRNDPAWKKLSSNPRYAFDQIVTNITNLVLSPLACSQL